MADRLLLLVAAGAVLAFATPSFAGSNVVCDNGLRCVMAPCPSTSAYDVKTKKHRKGVWVDIEGMSAADQREIARSEALYLGTRVMSGRFEQRKVKGPTGTRSLPYFVADGIERKSTRREQRLCRG